MRSKKVINIIRITHRSASYPSRLILLVQYTIHIWIITSEIVLKGS